MTDSTHQAHCCRFHGCKYDDRDCPVVNNSTVQSYPCENCNAEQGRAIQEARFPRCGRMPLSNTDNMPCFLDKDHKSPIHRNLGGFFYGSKDPASSPTAAPAPAQAQARAAYLTKRTPSPHPPAYAPADRTKQQEAIETLREAIHKARALGMGSAWEALYLIEAVMARQEKTIKRIQQEYLALVERRIFDISNKATQEALVELREELENK